MKWLKSKSPPNIFNVPLTFFAKYIPFSIVGYFCKNNQWIIYPLAPFLILLFVLDLYRAFRITTIQIESLQRNEETKSKLVNLVIDDYKALNVPKEDKLIISYAANLKALIDLLSN